MARVLGDGVVQPAEPGGVSHRDELQVGVVGEARQPLLDPAPRPLPLVAVEGRHRRLE